MLAQMEPHGKIVVCERLRSDLKHSQTELVLSRRKAQGGLARAVVPRALGTLDGLASIGDRGVVVVRLHDRRGRVQAGALQRHVTRQGKPACETKESSCQEQT